MLPDLAGISWDLLIIRRTRIQLTREANGWERMTVENISWSVSTRQWWGSAGIEPATFWSPVGRAYNWFTEATFQIHVVVTREFQLIPTYNYMNIKIHNANHIGY